MAASAQIAVITLTSLFCFQFLSGSCSATILTITNKCNYRVWPGIRSGKGASPLSTTGFALEPGESNVLSVPAAWSGWLWGRTLCSQDSTRRFSCVTGDCGSSSVECAGGNAALPVTLADFALNGTGGTDLFAVSLVTGFNLPMRLEPQDGTGNCRASGCVANLNVACPAVLKVLSDGVTVACKSPCQSEPCSSSLASQFFKSACPGTRIHFNDPSFTCVSSGYTITFCPTTTSTSSMKLGSGKFPWHLPCSFIAVAVVVVAVVAAAVIILMCYCYRSRCCRGTSKAETIVPNTLRPPVNGNRVVGNQSPASPSRTFSCNAFVRYQDSS